MFRRNEDIPWTMTVAASEILLSIKKASEIMKVAGAALLAMPPRGPMREKLLKNRRLISVSPSSSSSSSSYGGL